MTLILEPDGVTIRTKRRRVTCWVQSVDYIDQEGRIELRFGKDILPYLTGLQREFTRYALSDVAKMTSAHAIRLYELLTCAAGYSSKTATPRSKTLSAVCSIQQSSRSTSTAR